MGTYSLLFHQDDRLVLRETLKGHVSVLLFERSVKLEDSFYLEGDEHSFLHSLKQGVVNLEHL